MRQLLVNLYIKLNFLLFSLQSWQQSLQRLSKHNLFRGKWKQWHSKRNLGKKFVLWLGEYVDNNCFDDTSGYLGTFPISNKTMSWTSKKVFWTSKHNWSYNLHDVLKISLCARNFTFSKVLQREGAINMWCESSIVYCIIKVR